MANHINEKKDSNVKKLYIFYLCVIFCLALVSSIIANFSGSVSAVSGDWTEQSNRASKVTVTSSTKTISISNANELAYVANYVNVGSTTYGAGFSGYTIKLTSNINLSDHYWTPIGKSSTYKFQGTFDGKGYTISNMTISKTLTSTQSYIGLFGYSTGTIQNVTLTNINIATTTNNYSPSKPSYVGGIAGYATGAISNCKVSGKITTQAKILNGIVGHSEKATSSCTDNVPVVSYFDKNYTDIYSLNTIKISTAGQLAYVAKYVNDGTDTDQGGPFKKGFSGYTIILQNNIDLSAYDWTPIGNKTNIPFQGTFDGDGKTISKMKINTSLTGSSVVGLFGYSAGQIKNVKITKAVIAALKKSDYNGVSHVGGLVGYYKNSNAISSCSVEAMIDSDAEHVGEIVGGYKSQGVGSDCSSNCTFGTYFNSASGNVISKDKEIYISTAKQLQYVAYYVNANLSDGFDQGFSGYTLKLVSGLDISAYNWVPIGSSSSYPFKGTFDGNYCTITGLKIDKLTGVSSYYWGLFGYSSGEIKNLNLINVDILIGQCSNSNISSYTGAIVGYSKNNISNCQTSGIIKSETKYIGGIAGYCNSDNLSTSKISNCINNCTITYAITGSSCTSIAGITNCCYEISYSYNNASLNSLSGNVYGIGCAYSEIKFCENKGNLTGYEIVAGIGKSKNSNISYCSNKGVIVAQIPSIFISSSFLYFNAFPYDISYYACGIGIVETSKTISYCVNTGSIAGLQAYGICKSASSISYCTNGSNTKNNTKIFGCVYSAGIAGSGVCQYCMNSAQIGKRGSTSVTQSGWLSFNHYGISTSFISAGASAFADNGASYKHVTNYGDVTGAVFSSGISAQVKRFISFVACANYGNITNTGISASYTISIQSTQTSYSIFNILCILNNIDFNDGICAVGGILASNYCDNTVGYEDFSINSSYNYGTVKGNTCCGGIIGFTNGSETLISNCFNKGNIGNSDVSVYTGGIVGRNSDDSCKYTSCYSNGAVYTKNGISYGFAGKKDGKTIASSNLSKYTNCSGVSSLSIASQTFTDKSYFDSSVIFLECLARDPFTYTYNNVSTTISSSNHTKPCYALFYNTLNFSEYSLRIFKESGNVFYVDQNINGGLPTLKSFYWQNSVVDFTTNISE